LRNWGVVAPAQLDAAHLDLPTLENAEIAIGHRDALVGPGGQEGHPAIDPVRCDRQSGALQDRIQQRLEIRRGFRAGLFYPHAVDVQVQHLKPQVLGGFLGMDK
jgi:hypothetical protein